MTVRRPAPKDLSTLDSALCSRHTGLSTPDLELGALTKWLASQMLVWVSRHSSLQFHIGTTLWCREVASCRESKSSKQVYPPGKWICQWCAKLWALHSPAMRSCKWVCHGDVPSCECYGARQTVCCMSCMPWSHRGHQLWKDPNT